MFDLFDSTRLGPHVREYVTKHDMFIKSKFYELDLLKELIYLTNLFLVCTVMEKIKWMTKSQQFDESVEGWPSCDQNSMA